MSTENLMQFMSKVADSEELQAKIGEEIDTEALMYEFYAECGCEFNADEWATSPKAGKQMLTEITYAQRRSPAHNVDDACGKRTNTL